VTSEISFDAPELVREKGVKTIAVDRDDVLARVKDLSKKRDLSKWVL